MDHIVFTYQSCDEFKTVMHNTYISIHGMAGGIPVLIPANYIYSGWHFVINQAWVPVRGATHM